MHGARKILLGQAFEPATNLDLWARFRAAAAGGIDLAIKRVKGHAEEEHNAAGLITVEERRANSGADKLATAGAATHPFPPLVKYEFWLRKQVVALTQRMMIAFYQHGCRPGRVMSNRG